MKCNDYKYEQNMANNNIQNTHSNSKTKEKMYKICGSMYKQTFFFLSKQMNGMSIFYMCVY